MINRGMKLTITISVTSSQNLSFNFIRPHFDPFGKITVAINVKHEIFAQPIVCEIQTYTGKLIVLDLYGF